MGWNPIIKSTSIHLPVSAVSSQFKYHRTMREHKRYSRSDVMSSTFNDSGLYTLTTQAPQAI